MKDLLKQDADRRSILEKYLARQSLHDAAPIDYKSLKFEEYDERISVESDDDTEEDPKVPKLDQLKRFRRTDRHLQI